MKLNRCRWMILVGSAALVTLLASVPVQADHLLHPFRYWGTMKELDKLNFYIGWTNGFFVARGQHGLEFANCLEAIDSQQALAMIDKRYKDYPEKWSNPITQQILEALTMKGSPCEGKNPLPSDSE